MKSPLFLFLLTLCQMICNAQNNLAKVQYGVYKQKGSSKKLELKPDGTYVLYNPEGSSRYVVQRCNYSSKGKWKQISNDALEITSENYYQQEEGFKYELRRENKFSQDSLYIKVNLPDSLMYYRDGIPVNFSFVFNHDVSKSIDTNQSFISIPKRKYLWAKAFNSIDLNHMGFSLNAKISGTSLYKSRIMFKIFEEDIDTEKTNYLTINLPNFNLCFFEFEPYKQELLFVQNRKELKWKGETWELLR